MIERSYLNLVISLIEEQDRSKLAKYIDSLSDSFEENHLWEADQLSLNIHLNEVRRITRRLKRIYRKEKYYDHYLEGSTIVRAQQGDMKARQEVIYKNLGYVVHIARKYQNRGLPLNDLIEEGYIGLIAALEKHDVNRGFSFRTYAKHYIVNSILTALSKYNTLIRYPGNILTAYNKVQRYIDLFQMKYNRMPTYEDIEEEIKLEENIVEYCYDTMLPDLSLDDISQYIYDFDLYDSFIDLLTDKTSSTMDVLEIDEDFRNESLAFDVGRSLSQLFDNEQKILRMFFGIGCKEHSLEEIAYHFGLSRERARQIKERSIRKLKGVRSSNLRKYLG